MVAPSFWDASYFDAVWSLVLALNRTVGETGVVLSEYHYGQHATTEAIRNHLLELDFEGVSGRIRFDNETGYVKRAVDVYIRRQYGVGSLLQCRRNYKSGQC